MLRRFTPALAAATLLLAACGGAGPAITDPREIVTTGLEATAELTSVHVVLSVDGNATIPDLGGGEMNLSGTQVDGDLDLENERAHLEFTVPPMFGLTGEIIQIGRDSYIKTSLTGATWSKSTAEEGDPVSEAMDPQEQLDQVREFLDKEGVEVEKLDDTECGDRTCYVVRLTIPAEVLSESAEGGEMDPGELVGEDLVLNLLFDREENWLTEVSTELSAETVGELSLTLTLSDFNRSVEVEAPPADEVTEGGGGLPF
ncbi:MAG TPA: hypothetical protein VF071_09560 [Candidatus Limnocylindria bacterium]